MVENGGVFCPNCGKPVQAAAQPQSAPPVYAAVPQAAPQPQAQPQPVYQANYQYGQPAGGYPAAPASEPLTVGQYIGMMILSGLPLVGFILLLVWAFGSEANLNKKNYAKAVLLLMVIGVALSILFSIVFGGIFATIMSSIDSY